MAGLSVLIPSHLHLLCEVAVRVTTLGACGQRRLWSGASLGMAETFPPPAQRLRRQAQHGREAQIIEDRIGDRRHDQGEEQ